ncbi:MAG: Ldh family oxidoreductase [Candidatus Brocadiae bacterium]|nr:Ldh family oxidoreductase [Candidatus Brocadiia bacterium]
MHQENAIYVPAGLLRRFMQVVFEKSGVPAHEAQICTDVLMEADLCGIDSHGINRLKMYADRIEKKIQLALTDWKIVSDKDSCTVIDGGNGMGQIVSYNAMKIAIEKARKYGCGISVARNSNHFGIAGYYTMMAVKNDMIGFTFTNARPSVNPTFGVEPLLGTNPISFGIPSDLPYPFLLDMATSICQRGKIEVLEKLGLPTPDGLVINNKGEYALDSKAILDDLVKGTAALLPLGGVGEETSGHKGYGLSTMVEILSTALSQANYLRETSGLKDGKDIPLGLGHFFMAIDIAHFLPVQQCKKIIGCMIRVFHESQKAPGQEKIYVAGEKEHISRQQREKQGIPINKTLQKMILELKNKWDLGDFVFPF